MTSNRYLIVYFVCNKKAIFDAITFLIVDGPRSAGIKRSGYIEYNDLGRKCCPEYKTSGIQDVLSH